MKIPFDHIADHARLWVFASPDPLPVDASERLLEQVDSFVDGWTAHGAPVAGAYQWREDRFLLVAADEAATGVSGCSIDSLSRTLRVAERELGISLLDASSRVWYRDGDGAIRALPRAGFRQLVQDGEADGETPVFDNTAATVGAVRRGEWERPMRESWHGRAFGAVRAG